MAFKVEIADSAKAELDEIVRYFIEELSNPVSAGKLLDDFYEQKSFLYDNPYMFPLCPIQVLQRKGYRRFLFMKNYVALYLVEDEEDKKVVTIMHVFYAKRDYEKLV
ncbi:MAG: type II toxin-antitoxin system RelE/ParE family toxin [Treponema sp.]|nr:type II toxin-antitoxin system RelE/ParE family toxin [Treponema sp.]